MLAICYESDFIFLGAHNHKIPVVRWLVGWLVGWLTGWFRTFYGNSVSSPSSPTLGTRSTLGR